MSLLLALMLLPQDAALPADTVTDAQIVEMAAGWDKEDRRTYIRDFGIHHGHRVVATFRCSDLCPDYMTRVIHYDVGPGPECAAIGGVEREAEIPQGIASRRQTFCVPPVLGTKPIPLGGG